MATSGCEQRAKDPVYPTTNRMCNYSPRPPFDMHLEGSFPRKEISLHSRAVGSFARCSLARGPCSGFGVCFERNFSWLTGCWDPSLAARGHTYHCSGFSVSPNKNLLHSRACRILRSLLSCAHAMLRIQCFVRTKVSQCVACAGAIGARPQEKISHKKSPRLTGSFHFLTYNYLSHLELRCPTLFGAGHSDQVHA
jgi:hypothetical protein